MPHRWLNCTKIHLLYSFTMTEWFSSHSYSTFKNRFIFSISFLLLDTNLNVAFIMSKPDVCRSCVVERCLPSVSLEQSLDLFEVIYFYLWEISVYMCFVCKCLRFSTRDSWILLVWALLLFCCFYLTGNCSAAAFLKPSHCRWGTLYKGESTFCVSSGCLH